MFFIPKWWISVVYLAGFLPHSCSGVNVFVRDEKRYAVLFQSVVLPCQYTSVSTQTPVVQWVFKSYCRDRTRESFNFHDTGGSTGGGRTGMTGGVGGGYETGVRASYLDCSDSSRTVRTVASITGSSITLSEYYKNRDISIINKADLRIGEVHWGDSGVYMCKVVIADDLEGQNEASVELLVLGFSGGPEDLLPGFHLKIMPEWVFVSAVALGSVLFLLLVGVCWCQCCPHSCCCYISCCCCPDTCCCPRHLYEAGKGIKTGTSRPQSPAYPPYFISGVPTMLPIAPPSLVEKMTPVPASNGSLLTTVPMHAVGVPSYHVPSSQDQNSLRVLQYVEKQLAHFNPARSNSHQSCSQSELSSLHEGETGFRQTLRTLQKQTLPAIVDQEPEPEPKRHRDNWSPEMQRHAGNLASPQRYRDQPDPRHRQEEPSSPRRYSDDPPATSPTHRRCETQRPSNHREEERYPRWNPRSEHLQRKSYRPERTGSLDELEEFATPHKHRGGRGAAGREEDERQMELREFSRNASRRNAAPQHFYDDPVDFVESSDREYHQRRSKKADISPLASPKKKKSVRGTDRPVPLPPTISPPSSSSQERDRDGAFLSSLLERKAGLRGAGQGRVAEDSDSPSKESWRSSRSPSNRPDVDSPTTYSDAERRMIDRLSPRQQDYSQSSQQTVQFPSSRRDETRDRSRKMQSTLLSRDSLIV